MPPSWKPLLAVAVHTLVLYLCLILGLRAVGRRQMGQFTVVDLVVIIVLGSAVETAMIAGNTSLAAGLVSAGTLLLANRLLTLAWLRSRRFRHLAGGVPVLLVYHGHLIQEHLRRTGLTETDVLEAIRERGEAGVESVQLAILETDGSINVVPAEREPPPGDARAHPPGPPP